MAKISESKRKQDRVFGGDQWLIIYMMTLIFLLGLVGVYAITIKDVSIAVAISSFVILIATMLVNLAAKPSFPVVLIPSGAGTPGMQGETGATGATGETGTMLPVEVGPPESE